jgi:hypothetical protein
MANITVYGNMGSASGGVSFIPQPAAATALASGQALMLSNTGSIVANDGTAPVIGFAPVGGVVAGERFVMQPPAASTGYTGLTPGATYYVQSNGALGTTPTAAYAGVARPDGISIVAAPGASALASVGTKLGVSGADVGAASVPQVFTQGIQADGMKMFSAAFGAVEIITGTPAVANAGTYSVVLGPTAGDGNTGSSAVIIGNGAGGNNSSVSAVLIGTNAGDNNTGSNLVAVGNTAAVGNTGSAAVSIGAAAGQDNAGLAAVLIGSGTGTTNAGDNVVALGTNAADGNAATGDELIAIGTNAGLNNTFANAIVLGAGAVASATGQVVLGGTSNTSILMPGAITLRQALSGYANHAAAVADSALPARSFYYNTSTFAVSYKP